MFLCIRNLFTNYLTCKIWSGDNRGKEEKSIVCFKICKICVLLHVFAYEYKRSQKGYHYHFALNESTLLLDMRIKNMQLLFTSFQKLMLFLTFTAKAPKMCKCLLHILSQCISKGDSWQTGSWLHNLAKHRHLWT